MVNESMTAEYGEWTKAAEMKVTEKQRNEVVNGMSVECWSLNTRIMPIKKPRRCQKYER